MSELIRLENVRKVYKMKAETVYALNGVDLVISKGEFVAVVGTSGSGKSTLLHVIGGLDTPTSGEVFFSGESLAKKKEKDLARYRNEKIGFVFQTFNLLPNLTTLENIDLPLLFAGFETAKTNNLALQAAVKVGLKERITHKPTELSGGERQRVAIARAIVRQPMLILADEPTGNLDSKTGKTIMELFFRLNREEGVSIVLVTHNESDAAYAQKRLKMADGRII